MTPTLPPRDSSSAAIELPPPHRVHDSAITESWVHKWSLKIILGLLAGTFTAIVAPAAVNFISAQEERASSIEKTLGEVQADVKGLASEFGHLSDDLQEVVKSMKELDRGQRGLELRIQAAEGKIELHRNRLDDVEYKLWDRDHEKWRATRRK